MHRVSFNSNWICNGKTVTLPHDAQISEKRGADVSNGGHGYFPGGVYTYEKAFTAPAEWEGKTVLVEFEGVYKNATVSLNGKELVFHAYGYTGFFVELSELNLGGENTLTVVADNSKLPNSRWYSGSGIYRPVWLHVGPKESIRPESVKISTVSIAPAIIRVQSPVSIKAEVANVCGEGTDFELTIPDAKLWSAEAPYLYTAKITSAEDETEVTFGIRQITWSNNGLFINGQETLLRGGCIHHDNGILGAATYTESEERRVRLLKEAGFNALRSSHNPASEALIEACDQYGLYLIDETWDMWYSRKSKFDYASDFPANFKDDIRGMVERDYNHPSVIMYSIGNEVSEPAQEKGVALAREIADFFHRLDPGRPVTGGINLMIISRSAKGKAIYKEEGGLSESSSSSGMSSTMFNLMASMVGPGMNKGSNGKKADAITSPVLDVLDIAGYNYASGRYPLEGKAHPNRVIFGSETFPQDIYKNWQMVKKYPYLVGDFMWTAWDYLGETGIGAWAYTSDGRTFDKPYPWLLADVGALNLIGDPNGEIFLAQAAWGLLKKPAIAVQPVNHPGVRPAKSVWRGTNSIPSWSWQGCEGNKAVVEVYFDAAKVELLLNGKSLGKATVKECKAVFKIKYAPGSLSAVAYDKAGKELARNELVSALGGLRLSVRSEKSEASCGEVVYVPVTVVGENGVVESNADRKLSVTVEGGELLAFGSANPRTEERYHTGEFSTYYGKALAVIRAGEAGTVTVRVSDGKDAAEALIHVVS